MNDPNYRRLRYIRYAHDFLLGLNGPKSEAEEIKQAIRTFLQEELKLELSETKTLITHAKSEAARFLGYEITIRQADEKQTPTKAGGKRRSLNGTRGFRIPREIVEEKCQNYMRHGKATHRHELEKESDYAIVMHYQLVYRGIVEYYRLAFNLHTLSKLRWIMEQSLTIDTGRQIQAVSVQNLREVQGRPHGRRQKVQRTSRCHTTIR